MNWADITILGIIAISVVVSIFRGFVREVLSLLAWVAAFWVAGTLAAPASTLLEPYIGVPTARIVLAFIGVMLATLIVAALINHLVGQLITRTGLGATDRLLGALFGFARGVLIVLAAVLAAGLTRVSGEAWWQNSQVMPPFERAAIAVIDLLPPDLARNFSF